MNTLFMALASVLLLVYAAYGVNVSNKVLGGTAPSQGEMEMLKNMSIAALVLSILSLLYIGWELLPESRKQKVQSWL